MNSAQKPQENEPSTPTTMVKVVEIKDDGRHLIYYTFIRHDNSRSEEEKEDDV